MNGFPLFFGAVTSYPLISFSLRIRNHTSQLGLNLLIFGELMNYSQEMILGFNSFDSKISKF